MHRILVRFPALLALLALVAATTAQAQVSVTAVDVTGVQSEHVMIPITMGDAGSDVYAYQFTASYNPAIFEITGIETAGTASASGVTMDFELGSGYINVAGAGVAPIADNGTLVYLKATLLNVGTSPLSFGGSLVLNGGSPASIGVDGTVTVTGVGIVHPTEETWVLKNNVYDVTVDDLGDGVVYSWEATFTYDPAIIDITSIITDGTLSASGSTQVNLLTPGLVTIASAYAQTINGGGVLFKIATTAVGVGVSPLTWTSFQINTGIPPGVLVNGSITVKPNPPAVAVNGTASVDEDSSVNITLTATDEDSDSPLTFAIASAPAHGTAVLNGDVVTYTPTANYNGPDSFTFTVFDGEDVSAPGTITITVNPVNDAPTTADVAATTPEDNAVVITLAGSDIDGDALTYFVVANPAHGSVVINGNQATYTPAQDYNGTDTFTYWVADVVAATSNVSTVTITVTPVNDAPVATDMTLTVEEDGVLVVNLAGYDVDGDALTYHITDGPQHGELSLVGGQVTYTPDADFVGTDTFKFHLNDGQVDSNIATATITVTAINDAPVATAGSATTAEDTAVDITLAGTDTEGSALTIAIATAPAHGTVTVNGAVVTYTPAADYNGADSFTFTVNDGTATSAPAAVAVTVSPVNDAPVFGTRTGELTIREDGTLSLLFPATDVDGDVLTWSRVTTGAWIGINSATGAVSGNPAGEAGVYTLDVSVSDGTVSVDHGQVMVMVYPVTAYATGLSGVNEVPLVASPGTGSFAVNVVEDQDLLEVIGTFEGLMAPITGAHIHWAPVGVNGPVVVPLTAVSANGRDGYFMNSFALSALNLPVGVTLQAFLDEIEAGNTYVNIHSSAHPAGEIRGQILDVGNRAPAATEVRAPATVVIAGNPTDRLLSVTWLPVNDPDGDKVNYILQMALQPQFSEVFVTESFGDGNGFRLTVAEAAEMFDDLTDRNPGNIAVGGQYTIFYRVITSDGWLWTAGPGGSLTMTRGLITDTEVSDEVPTEFALRGNYPNPFNPSTNITFDLPESADVSVQVLDILGREVASMPARTLDAGTGRSIQFDADELQSGIYFYRVVARSHSSQVVRTGTMTLVK